MNLGLMSMQAMLHSDRRLDAYDKDVSAFRSKKVNIRNISNLEYLSLNENNV